MRAEFIARRSQQLNQPRTLIRITSALALAVVVSLVSVAAVPAAVCTVSAAGFNFGTYNPKQPSPLDASAYISIACTAGTPYLLGMDNGLNYLSPWRRERNGGNSLNYQLYLDSGRSLVWGMTPGSSMMPGTGTGSPQNIPVYGRIPAFQEPPDGSYSDTVSVTVEYQP